MPWRLDIDHARRTPWTVVYLAAGVAMVVNLAGDAYARATSLCELYPQFAFGETLKEEVLLHHTRLPIVRAPVSTVLLLGAYAAGFVALRYQWLDKAWLLLHIVLSGRWLSDLLFVHLPRYVPFLRAEPGVPELLSDGEESDSDYGFGDAAFAPPAPPVDAQQTQRALDKLRQVKLAHANCTIERPDDWLVFDPEQEALVLQKTKLARVSPSHGGRGESCGSGCVASASVSGKHSELNTPSMPENAIEHPVPPPVRSPSQKRSSEQGFPAELVPNGAGTASVRSHLSSPRSRLATLAH